MSKVSEFPLVPGLTDTSKIAVAQRSTAEGAEDFHCTPSQILAYLQAKGAVIPVGTYNSDAEAILDGHSSGTWYTTGTTHDEAPAGLIKQIA